MLGTLAAVTESINLIKIQIFISRSDIKISIEFQRMALARHHH